MAAPASGDRHHPHPTLTRSQWLFALGEIQRSIPIYQELGDSMSLQLGRDAIVEVTAQLG